MSFEYDVPREFLVAPPSLEVLRELRRENIIDHRSPELEDFLSTLCDSKEITNMSSLDSHIQPEMTLRPQYGDILALDALGVSLQVLNGVE